MSNDPPSPLWEQFRQAVQGHDAEAFGYCLEQGVDVNTPLTDNQPTALCQLLHDWLDTDDRSTESSLERCLLALAQDPACRWEGEVFLSTSTGAASHLLTVPEALELPAMRWLADYKASLDRSEQLDKALAPTMGRQEKKPRF